MVDKQNQVTEKRGFGGVISSPGGGSQSRMFLEAGKRLSLSRDSLASIICLQGRVRLIDSQRSYILAAGEAFVPIQAGEINLRALGDAAIGVSRRAGAPTGAV